MNSGERGITQPRLRVRDVLLRGALYGLASIVVLLIAMWCVGDHSDREEFLAVVGGIALVFGGVFVVFGAFLWACCRGDIRRWRDFRSITSEYEGATIMAPAMVRCGVMALVLASAAIGLNGVVDEAAYVSRLYGI
ncbi:DUF6336 family protein [Streptomyces sp. RTd22]|uniref:DUF6336 family protein n=1 Tax=Streptomyces sp. RTd22 TaxID=1841249 RepID=UPI0007C569C0|nr:DUF6336 family protein [Streptomyces sp. RTd22]